MSLSLPRPSPPRKIVAHIQELRAVARGRYAAIRVIGNNSIGRGGSELLLHLAELPQLRLVRGLLPQQGQHERIVIGDPHITLPYIQIQVGSDRR